MSEFIDELDDIFVSLDQRLDENNMTREELVVFDVYSCLGGIEGDGVQAFWHGADDPDRALESFSLLGVPEVADAIAKTRWVIDVMERGTTPDGQYKFTHEQEENLSEIEGHVYRLFNRLPTRLFEYVKQHGIKG